MAALSLFVYKERISSVDKAPYCQARTLSTLR